MESKSFLQTLANKDWRFRTATTLEDVLCFSTMVSQGILFPACDVEEARSKWVGAAEDGGYEGDCYKCPCHETCIACIINE